MQFSFNIESLLSSHRLILSSFLGPLLGLFVLSTAIYYVYHDYQAWLALGPGGGGQKWYDYCGMNVLRLIIIRNPLVPGPVPLALTKLGYFSKTTLSNRGCPRPKVRGIAPQRMLDQKPPSQVFDLLSQRIRDLAYDHPKELEIGTSCFEKHSPGLFAKDPLNHTCKGEVVHAHPSDSSMHLTLHPADAKVVIESGWGERHPYVFPFHIQVRVS